MGGTFSKTARPLLPGAYFNVQATIAAAIQPSTGSTVAIPFTHTWGPFKVPTLLTSFAQFEAIYGTDSSPGRTAVFQAFQGEGVEGRGGAGAVLAYRTGAAGAAKASKILQNTTPATAVTLTAIYEGTHGNQLKVAVVDTPSSSPPAPTTDLVLYIGSQEVERFTFTDTDIASLVAQINGTAPGSTGSGYVTATQSITGVALTVVSTPSAFTGGNDGSTLITADWTNLLNALSLEQFGVFAPYDLTDSTIQTAIAAWQATDNQRGKRFMTVLGGGNSDSVSTSVSRSGGFASPDMVNLGDFVVTDDNFGSLTSSQLAPRYAGVIAQRGEVESATLARLGGVSAITAGPNLIDQVSLFQGGVVSVARDSSALAPVHFTKALTTFTSTTDAQRPYLIFREPKFVRTIHGIQNEFTEWLETEILGQTVVNDKTRDAVRGELLARLSARVTQGVIQENPTADIDTDPPPSDDDDFIAIVLGVKFGRSAEQVLVTLRVG